MDENLQLEFDWLELRHKVKDNLKLDKLPDLNAVLLFIGVQELGRWKSAKFKKEEKQDLMHIAVCTLMSEDGYFKWDGLDTDGWPHFKALRLFDMKGVDTQENYLKAKAISYFRHFHIQSTSIQ
jgi:hypothetical protein